MNQPSPEPSEVPSSTGSQADAPTHFDSLIGDKTETAPAALATGMMTKDEFHAMFIGGFKVGHAFTKFQSLHIADDRTAKAEACSHALYETIVDVPSLHFILEPSSKWWGRTFAIGSFMVPTVIGISMEIKARKEAAARPAAANSATVEPQAEDQQAMGGE